MQKKYVIIFIFITGYIACNKDNIVEMFIFNKPSYFPELTYDLETNPISKEKFELGKKLFYDPILSVDNSISCGSCHIQTSAFTHHGHPLSHGIYDRQGKRNSPPIMNLAWSPNFMWDGGIFNLDLQPIIPITNHEEMGETMFNIVKKLNNHVGSRIKCDKI